MLARRTSSKPNFAMLLGKNEPIPVLPVPDSVSTGLILFVKAPQVGKVKTRLGKGIGLSDSCELYRQFGLDLVQRLNTLPFPLLIFYAPAEQQSLIRSWLGEHQYFPQQGEDLGDRMTHAFEVGFKLGFKQLLILGSDSPDVPLSYVMQGQEALGQDNTVIGPSNDGGYYTLGFSQVSWCPRVFRGINWSTDTVFMDSLRILRSHSAPVQVLPQWFDVDTLTDLKAFYQRNRDSGDVPNSVQYLDAKLGWHFEASS